MMRVALREGIRHRRYLSAYVSAKWGSVRMITRCATRYSKYRIVFANVYGECILGMTRSKADRIRMRIPNSSRESVVAQKTFNTN